jgi:predicted O-methyltransferase YrrM
MEPFDHAWSSAAELDGWLTLAQAKRLYAAASRLSEGELAVEIGSHKGKSAIVIGAALPDRARLVAIDPFDDPRWGGGSAALSEFHVNLANAGVSSRVRLMRGLSGEISETWPASSPIAMLYIDGAHDYPTVAADIRSWCQRIRPGGSLLIHDAFSSVGVTRAVLRHLGLSQSFEYQGADRTLVEFWARPASAWSRIRLYARLVYFARNIGVKIALTRGWPWLRIVLGQRIAEHPY